MKENYNNYDYDKNYDKAYNAKPKNPKQESVKSYSYYSRLLNKPFDTLSELEKAEHAYQAEQRAKEDKATQKKADAKKVEDAFKALNAERKKFKEDLVTLTEWYSKELGKLKKDFEAARNSIQGILAATEENYSKALKEFTEKYPEGYHLTLKDGDFETTISNTVATGTKTGSLFEYLFSF